MSLATRSQERLKQGLQRPPQKAVPSSPAPVVTPNCSTASIHEQSARESYNSRIPLVSSPASPTIAGVTVGREVAADDASSNFEAGTGGSYEEVGEGSFKRTIERFGVHGGIAHGPSRIQLHLPSDCLAASGAASEMNHVGAVGQHAEYRSSMLGDSAAHGRESDTGVEGGSLLPMPDEMELRAATSKCDKEVLCIK